MEEAKISVIYDEGAIEGTTYIGARGFSLLVEADGERTLFGVGRRPRYLTNNLYVADIDPDSVDRVVVSHGHADHWGAISGLLKERESPVKVYAPASAWGDKRMFGATGMFVPTDMEDKVERQDVSGWIQLSEHLFVSAPFGFYKDAGEEIFLVLKTLKGPILLSGCCHCGLDHVFEAVRDKFGGYPIGLIGGLHIGERKDKLADLYAEYIEKTGCRKLYLNHCTGVFGIGRLRTTLGLKGVNDFYVGESVTFDLF